MTIYTQDEVAKHRREVESWSWLRQFWHRWIDADCPLCVWHRIWLKYPKE